MSEVGGDVGGNPKRAAPSTCSPPEAGPVSHGHVEGEGSTTPLGSGSGVGVVGSGAGGGAGAGAASAWEPLRRPQSPTASPSHMCSRCGTLHNKRGSPADERFMVFSPVGTFPMIDPAVPDAAPLVPFVPQPVRHDEDAVARSTHTESAAAVVAFGAVPPMNFAQVEPGLYRSGYPTPASFGFLNDLGIVTVMCVGVLCSFLGGSSWVLSASCVGLCPRCVQITVQPSVPTRVCRLAS